MTRAHEAPRVAAIDAAFLTVVRCKEFNLSPGTRTIFATLNGKGQITLPKEIRDRLGLDAGSMLDIQVLPDNTITARAVKPDARRIRGLLQSPHPEPLTVEQMDEAVSRHLRAKHAPRSGRAKPTGQ